MKFDHPVTVVVLRSGGWDRYGNPLPEEEHDLPGCAVAPGSSEDVVAGSDSASGGAGVNPYTTADYVVFAPTGADVRGEDRVRLPEPWSSTWQVTGIPEHFLNPFTGDRPGVRVYLTGRA